MTPAAMRAQLVSKPYRITAVERESADVFTWELQPIAEGIGSFSPGQFTMLYHFGAGEVPISISGDTAPGRPLVHTIRSVGLVTRSMENLRVGNMVGVRGPYGTTWPIAAAEGRDVVLVAGGIGLAPLRPVVLHLLAHREKFGRVAVLYGARTPADMIFAAQCKEWAARRDLQFEATVDMGTDAWRGHVGVVTKLIDRVAFDPSATMAMMCGPEIMMRFAAKALESRGVAAEAMIVSLERNMQCAVGLCGHCMVGPVFVCKDGAVFPYPAVRALLAHPEI